MAIQRQTGKGKPTIWRWQARFMAKGVDGLLHEATRPAGKPPLSAEVIERVVEMTLAAEGSVVGMTIEDLHLPSGAVLLAVVRDGALVRPDPHAKLEAADEIIMLASVEVEDQIRTALREIVARALRKAPQDRYDDATQMADALLATGLGEPVKSPADAAGGDSGSGTAIIGGSRRARYQPVT